jgi:hypothetical protein
MPKGARQRGSTDLLGAATVTARLAVAVYAIVRVPETGSGSGQTPASKPQQSGYPHLRDIRTCWMGCAGWLYVETRGTARPRAHRTQDVATEDRGEAFHADGADHVRPLSAC